MLECCLRSLSVGSDTPVYEWMYSNINDYSWSDIWQIFVNRYFKGTDDTDIGYLFLQKLISVFTKSWRVFTFIAQLLFFVPLGILLYRHTTYMVQLVFAFVFHVALVQIFPLTGARQLYSIGLTIAAFLYMENNRIVNTILCLLFGATIHMSSLIFIVPLILARFSARTLKVFHFISFLLIPLFLIYGASIVQMMGEVVGMDRYSNYGMYGSKGGGYLFMSMIEFLSLFCFIALKEADLNNDKLLQRMYTMLPLLTVTAVLLSVDGAMIRLSLYFHLYLMLLVPYAVELMFPKDKKIVYIVLIILLGGLCINNGLIYHFYWQEAQDPLRYVM